MAKRLLLQFCLVAGLILLWHYNSYAASSDDVTIHLNGGKDKAYLGLDNTLEIWFTNRLWIDAFTVAFEFNSVRSFTWNTHYGDRPFGGPFVMRREPAVLNCFDLDGSLINVSAMNNTSPDSFLVGAASLNESTGLPIHNTPVFCYSLKFNIPSTEQPSTGGICIDNINFFPPPQTSWVFDEDTSTTFISVLPSFQGAPNSSQYILDAPPVCFDIVQPPCNCGDANGDASKGISDAVFLVQYIFAGGSAPTPLCNGDYNGDCVINISDAVALVAYIFSGGPAPNMSCNFCP